MLQRNRLFPVRPVCFFLFSRMKARKQRDLVRPRHPIILTRPIDHIISIIAPFPLIFLPKIQISLGEPSFRSAGRVVLAHSGNGCEHLLLVTEDGGLHTCGCNDL